MIDYMIINFWHSGNFASIDDSIDDIRGRCNWMVDLSKSISK